MSTVNQLSHSVRRATASATKSFARSHEQDDADTREYQRLIASLHEEWDRLESQASTSVMPQRHLMDAILAETRHGAQVEMPATDLGPYSMSEFSLRALIRRTVDGVPGARALRSTFEHAPSSEGHRGLGVPQTISCRISAHAGVGGDPAGDGLRNPQAAVTLARGRVLEGRAQGACPGHAVHGASDERPQRELGHAVRPQVGRGHLHLGAVTGLGEDGVHQVALRHDRGTCLRLQPVPLLVQGGDQTLVLARVGVVLLMRPGEGLGGRRRRASDAV